MTAPVTTGRQFFPVGTPVRYQDALAAEPSACVETLTGPELEECFSPGDCGTYVGTTRDGRGSFPVVAVRIGERDLLAIVPPHCLVEIGPARGPVDVLDAVRVGNLHVGTDASNCIVIVDRHSSDAGGHTITVTDVNGLKAALDMAVINQSIREDAELLRTHPATWTHTDPATQVTTTYGVR